MEEVYIYIYISRGGTRNFCLKGPSCNTNIFIKITSDTHIYTLAFLLYTHIFLFDKLFIYNTPKKKKKKLVFLIKIMFDGDLS